MVQRPFGLIAIAAALCLWPAVTGGAPQPGQVAGTIKVTAGGRPSADASRVVVYLEVAGTAAATPNAKATIRQKSLQFDPQLAVITKGTTVDFPNDDKVFHNVFSTSRPARFDLGLYRSGSSKSVQFKRAGVVDIFCNIHPGMISRVVVVDSRYFALTDAAGKFKIPGVPPGTYSIVARHVFGQEVRGQVAVDAGRVATLELTVESGAAPRLHQRKDGTPYGRYE